MLPPTSQDPDSDFNDTGQHENKDNTGGEGGGGGENRPLRLSERFSSFLPPKMKYFASNSSNSETPDPKDNSTDLESQEKNEQTTVTVRWIVCVTIAALIVSVLVLTIVLISLLSPTASPSASHTVGDGSDNISPPDDFPWESEDVKGFHKFVTDNIKGAMNPKVNPCDDFYEYACGRWAVHNPPPRGVSRWSNFEDMTITIWDLMQEQLDKVAMRANGLSKTERGSSSSSLPPPRKVTEPSLLTDASPFVVDLVGVYYNTCENETHLESLGAAPLKEILDRMDKKYNSKLRQLQPLSVFQDMLEYVHHELTVQAFFGWKVEMDNSIAHNMVIELTTPAVDLIPQGTVMEGNDQLIATYRTYAKNLLEIVGTYRDTDPDNEADIIIDMFKIYQPINGSPLVNATSISELNTIAPFLNWQKYFNYGFNKVGAFVTQDERILSMIQDYLVTLSEKLSSEISNNGSQRLYKLLRWHVAQYYSQFLHKAARNTILPLFDRISGENTAALPNFRYRPCIKEMEDRLAIPMGYLLLETVKKQLPKRTDMKDMVKNIQDMAHKIREEYKNYIASFEWLTSKAKNMLLNKLSFIKILVGYPPILDDLPSLQAMYASLLFQEDQLIQNQIQLLKFNQLRKMRFLRQPQTYTEWEVLSPMSLISFYVYRRNTLLIPLGGFMYPFYTSDLPEVLSYATMGLFISHEIGHAIDFVGRTRDQFGRTNATMWDDTTVTEFVQRVLCRVNDYTDRYYPVEGLLTIAEVMADDGSIGTAYETIRNRLFQSSFPTPLQDFMSDRNLSPDQLFFIYYAQLFCSASPAGVPLKGIDHYPPHPVRVRATLANTPAFHRAFECPRGSFMNPIRNQTCDIW